MTRRGTERTGSLSEEVYRRIRNSIIDGVFTPGMRLQPAALGEEYGASTTVVREALANLAGERLILSEPGQGYFVPEIQRDVLRDLTAVRCNTESLALTWAMERGGLDWESDLLAAHHRLSRTPQRLEDNHPNPEWARVHTAFHAALVRGCGVPILIDMCEQLSAAAAIYRMWSTRFTQSAHRDVALEHQEILDAVLSHDRDLAVQRLCAHYETTAQLIIAHWPDMVDGPAGAGAPAEP
jgi:DNA-binding GntR family transcriptional regulator